MDIVALFRLWALLPGLSPPGWQGITVNTVSFGCCDARIVLGQTLQEVQEAITHWAGAGFVTGQSPYNSP